MVKAQTVQDSILAVNFNDYLDKPIDSLIFSITCRFVYESVNDSNGERSLQEMKKA